MEPGRYAGFSAYTLLEAASQSYIAVDHRLLHAILDRPETSIPDLVSFAAARPPSGSIGLELELLDMFRHLRTPEALPFLIGLVRESPDDVQDDVVEAFVDLGAAAVEPLLKLLGELGEPDAGDVPFLLSALRARDSRIFEALIARLQTDPLDGALCLEVYGDPAAVPALRAALDRIPEQETRAREQVGSAIDALASPAQLADETHDRFDIWDLYPEHENPDYGLLEEESRLALLSGGSEAVRREAALSFEASEPSEVAAAGLLKLAKTDPETSVRGACWQGLAKLSDDPELRATMLRTLGAPETALAEKAGVAVALARNYESEPALAQAIETLYQDPLWRAQALKAMGYSLDRRFVAYPPKHLDDPDPDVKRQAMLGVGYLQLAAEAPRLEAFFEDDDYRLDALFAYALATPGETSPGRARALLDKVEQVVGGFREDERKLAMFAIDQRLMLRGKSPVFFPEDEDPDEPAEATPASAAKVGRNDACPCGSGKKFKKCCGAD